MKKSVSGITIAEVAVSLVIFSVSMVYMTKLQAENISSQIIVDKEIKIKRFSKYVEDLFMALPQPAYSDGQVFYIEEDYLDPNIYTFTTSDPISGKMPIWFFRSNELFSYSHKLTQIDSHMLWWILYTTYKVEVTYDDDIEEYFVIR